MSHQWEASSRSSAQTFRHQEASFRIRWHRPMRMDLLDSYRFIRIQEYFNKFMQLVGVGGCFGWSGRLYGRPIRVCCWAVVLQRVDGERGCWRGARRVVCERE